MSRTDSTAAGTRRRDAAIAAAVTMTAALLILLLLFSSSLGYDDRATLAAQSVPELQAPDEIFLEPELMQLGEESASGHQEAAPSALGTPVEADTPEPLPTEKSEAPEPAPVRKSVSTTSESPVKVRQPKSDSERDSKVTAKVAGAFARGDGKPSGKPLSAGAGGSGAGIRGSVRGRGFLGCDKPDVALRQKTTVTVDITVDAAGRVTSARARSGATAAIRRSCEQAARTARWSESPGAAPARGTITFTITPR